MAKWVHRLSNIDLESETATCANCGEVALKILTGGRAPKCMEAYLATNKSKKYRLRNGLPRVGEGFCDICGTETVLRRDHDHNCCPGRVQHEDCVRGYLCHKCNVGLGHFNDNIELVRAALKYLEYHNKI